MTSLLLPAACGILLVGGAVKKVITDPADECLDAGQPLASAFVRSSAGLLGLPQALPRLRRD